MAAMVVQDRRYWNKVSQKLKDEYTAKKNMDIKKERLNFFVKCGTLPGYIISRQRSQNECTEVYCWNNE